MSDPTRHVHDIAELAKAHEFKVGAAESLTGGAVSSALAMGSEAASWYHGCVVAYGRAVKEDLLGVTAERLVTAQCAEEMVVGATRVLEVDAAVATTGAGGPGEEEGQPPGTVWVGVRVRGETTSHRLSIPGDPADVVESATEQALGLLLDRMRAWAESSSRRTA